MPSRRMSTGSAKGKEKDIKDIKDKDTKVCYPLSYSLENGFFTRTFILSNLGKRYKRGKAKIQRKRKRGISRKGQRKRQGEAQV